MSSVKLPRKSTVREYFESIVIAVILALFIRTWIVQAFKIPTGSMEQNLLIGDHLLVNKFVFGPVVTDFERVVLPEADVRRGDILVFKYPQEPERAVQAKVRWRVSKVLPMLHTLISLAHCPPGNSTKSFSTTC